jgi:hypothetical protein
MARNTFQGLMRTTCGRPASVPNRASNPPGLPADIARMTLAGVIQCRGLNLGAADLVIGMLPAGWFPVDSIGMVAPSGGTVAIVLPAYRGLPEVILRTAAAVVPGTVTPAASFATYSIDRPIAVRGVALTQGPFIVGLRGFPLDDASIAAD